MWQKARLEFYSAISEMCAGLYQEDPSPDVDPQKNIQLTLATFANQPIRGVALVYLDRNVPVAYALLSAFWSNELGGEVCTIDELFTKKEFRSRGIAKDLFAQLSGPSDLWPVNTVALELEVSPINKRSRALYEKMGFSAIKNSLLRKKL
jgi:GNAT superfamily N-acetyltransferase